MKKFMKKLIKKAEGFTLVELIVVIAILGILAAVAVPAYSGYLTKAKEAGDIVELDAIKTAAQAYYAKTGSVTNVVVTETNGTTAATVKVTTTASAEANIAAEKEFNLYYTGSESTSAPNITLESGSSATWNGTAWTIS